MPRRPRNSEVTKALGARIRAAREQANLTQASLASLINSTAPTISRLEAGHMAPTLTTLTVVADALSIQLSSLFEDDAFRSAVTTDNLSPIEVAVINKFKTLTPEVQAAIRQLIESI